MLGVIALTAAVLATPAPPLKTITNVRISPFCTALRERVAPAVRTILENKPVVTQGKSLLLEMAHDQISGANPQMVLDLHMVQMNNLIGPMAQNLIATNDALNALDQAAKSGTADDARLQQMRVQLQEIADRQNAMLNVFSGMYGSYTSNELLGRANPLGNALSRTSKPPAPFQQEKDTAAAPIVVPDSKGTTQQEPAPNDSSTPEPVTIRSVDIGLEGGTAFAGLYNELTTYQLQELQMESKAADLIQRSAALCR
ncbi:MAG TPA: hypothetical protein VKT72_14840 [Candidatus Baltobacteraceae bacterium]|nr:hypothetical protein [Candidatus Baltobacteraceae bacterium]